MDGFQLAREMRKQASTANALLVAVTGYGQAADRLRSQEAGFDYHLVKPVSAEEIQRVITSRFRIRRHERTGDHVTRWKAGVSTQGLTAHG